MEKPSIRVGSTVKIYLNEEFIDEFKCIKKSKGKYTFYSEKYGYLDTEDKTLTK